MVLLLFPIPLLYVTSRLLCQISQRIIIVFETSYTFVMKNPMRNIRIPVVQTLGYLIKKKNTKEILESANGLNNSLTRREKRIEARERERIEHDTWLENGFSAYNQRYDGMIIKCSLVNGSLASRLSFPGFLVSVYTCVSRVHALDTFPRINWPRNYEMCRFQRATMAAES